ncbi:MAG: hypothetical protein CVV41_18150 [Candidatus Riflebacteria bacterium HGW-Riflebacteria-1]|jgi:hypothetical protein|nr:MAG: hypothetical protein CVV41_18150 [Candidatus Riflebacteria bacterium HGW-Riflebacteria-1]
MGTKEILIALKKLPVNARILIVEKTLKNIRKAAPKKNLESAAEALLEDYESDKELTAFSSIDFESFYEAR